MNKVIPELEKPLSEDVNQSFTLSSEYYLNPDIYEAEKENIFYCTWQYVAHECMLPNVGDYITQKICDQNIFVIRADNGELRAYYNVCQHRAHELLEGVGNTDSAIVCPYHAWTYKTDGSLIAANMSDKRPGFNKCDFRLKAVQLEIFCGCVFVNLDPFADNLKSMAGDLEQDIKNRIPYLDELKLCGTDMFGQTHTAAGWKVVVDNFLECYHCVPAHPDFASVIDMKAYRVDVFDYWSRQLGPEIRHQNSAYPVDPNEGFQSSVFWYLWPNTTFNVMPGSNELSVFAIRPTGLGTSNFEGQSFTSDGKINEIRAKYVSDVLVPEDVGLCESVQRGLQSKGYDQGPFIYDAERSGISEHALHHFHYLVHQALNV